MTEETTTTTANSKVGEIIEDHRRPDRSRASRVGQSP